MEDQQELKSMVDSSIKMLYNLINSHILVNLRNSGFVMVDSWHDNHTISINFYGV